MTSDKRLQNTLDNKKEETAANGQFGASRAVSRPKVCANLEVLLSCERQ